MRASGRRAAGGPAPALWVAALVCWCYCSGSSAHVPTIHAFTVPENETFQATMIPLKYRHLPIVSKCCQVDEFLSKKDPKDKAAAVCQKNSTAYKEFSPLFHDFNATGLIEPSSEMKEFVAVVNDPCHHNRYMLEPDVTSEDEYYLLLNGSVYAPHHLPFMLTPGVDYCMEVVPSRGLAILVCFPEEQEEPKADFLITLYACGLLISVPFLLLTAAAYALTPLLWDAHALALSCYCCCLALAFAVLALVQLASAYLSSSFCTAVAFIIQFSFVACFFWLNAMCIETYRLARRHAKGRSYIPTEMERKQLYFYYSMWAWIPTAVLVIISLCMELDPMVPSTYVKPNFGQNSCWFNSNEGAKPYFYVPVSLLVCINLVLFGLTALEIVRYQRELELRQLAMNIQSEHEERQLFRRLKRVVFVCLGLFFLMGINWVMELISWWAGGNPLAWSAFDFVNALQGVLVFGLFVLRRPVRNIVWHSLMRRLQGEGSFDGQEDPPKEMNFYLMHVMGATDTHPHERMS